MKKPSDKTIKYIAIGGLGLYLLSKMNLTGKIGSGIGDALGSMLGGLGEGLGSALSGLGTGLGTGVVNVVTGAVEGVVNTFEVPMKATSSALVNSAASVAEGHARYADWAWAMTPVGGALSALTLVADAKYNAGAARVEKSTGYSTENSYTWLTVPGQTKAAQLNAIRVSHPTWNPVEVNYAWAAANGENMTGWGTVQGSNAVTSYSMLTPAFKKEVGIT